MLATIADIKDLKNEKNKIIKFFKWIRYSFRLKKKLLTKLHGSITKGDLVDLGLVHAYLSSIHCNGNTDVFMFETIPADVRFDLVAVISLRLNIITDSQKVNVVMNTIANSDKRRFTMTVQTESDRSITSWSITYDEEEGLVKSDNKETNTILSLCSDGMKVYTLMAIDRLKGYIYEH